MYPKKVDSQILQIKARRSAERKDRLLALVKKADDRIAQQRRNAPTISREAEGAESSDMSENAPTMCSSSEADTGESHNNDQLPESYDWARLDRYANLIQGMEESKEILDKRESQRKLREYLNKQISESKKRLQLDGEANMEYARNVQAEVSNWQEYEQRLAQVTRQRAAIEREERDEQIRFNKSRKDAESAKRSREDKELIERIAEEVQLEERERVERKKKEREVMQRLIQENEKEQERKCELKRLSTEAELAQIREYNSLIERQEAERQAELNKRLERQRLLIKKMEETVMTTIQAKADDDNQRALMQQAEREARDLEVERFKQDNLARMRHEMINMLHQQMAEKADRRREDAELRGLHASILRADTQAFKDTENSKRNQRKDLYRRYREQLQEQIENSNNYKARAEDTMTKEEIKLNKELIAVVEKILGDANSECFKTKS